MLVKDIDAICIHDVKRKKGINIRLRWMICSANLYEVCGGGDTFIVGWVYTEGTKIHWMNAHAKNVCVSLHKYKYIVVFQTHPVTVDRIEGWGKNCSPTTHLTGWDLNRNKRVRLKSSQFKANVAKSVVQLDATHNVSGYFLSLGRFNCPVRTRQPWQASLGSSQLRRLRSVFYTIFGKYCLSTKCSACEGTDECVRDAQRVLIIGEDTPDCLSPPGAFWGSGKLLSLFPRNGDRTLYHQRISLMFQSSIRRRK